jgi:hypothetical protein
MATEMLDAGVPVPTVAARLAHAPTSTTLNVYAHAVPDGDRLANGALWRKVEEARRDSPDSSADSNSRTRTKPRTRSVARFGPQTLISWNLPVALWVW